MGKQKRPIQKQINEGTSWDDYLKQEGLGWDDLLDTTTKEDERSKEPLSTPREDSSLGLRSLSQKNVFRPVPFQVDDSEYPVRSMPERSDSLPFYTPETDTLNIEDVTAPSETTSQRAADSMWKQVLTQEAAPKEPTELEKRLNELGRVREEIERKAGSLDQNNEVAIADFNEYVNVYNQELEKIKQDYPAFRLDPEILRNFNLSFQGAAPEHYLTQGKGTPSTERLSDSEGAGAFSTLTKSLYQNKPISQIEKESGFLGKPIGRLAGSFGQGVLSVPGGVAGFVDHVTDTMGITDEGQKSKIAQTFEDWSQALAPEDPNFMEKVFSGFGSMAVFLPLGIGATTLAKGMAMLNPGIAHSVGTGAMTIIEAMTEAGNVYNQTGNGIAAEKSFWANIFLIGITNRFGIRNPKQMGAIHKALLSAPLEGMQEFGQNLIESWATDKPVNWMEAIEDFGVGAIVGGTFAGGGGETGTQTQKQSSIKDLGKGTLTVDQESLNKSLDSIKEAEAKTDTQYLDQLKEERKEIRSRINDLKKKQEKRKVIAAYRDEKGNIFTGATHPQAIEDYLIKKGLELTEDNIDEAIDNGMGTGFVNDKGEFLTQDEAREYLQKDEIADMDSRTLEAQGLVDKGITKTDQETQPETKELPENTDDLTIGDFALTKYGTEVEIIGFRPGNKVSVLMGDGKQQLFDLKDLEKKPKADFGKTGIKIKDTKSGEETIIKLNDIPNDIKKLSNDQLYAEKLKVQKKLLGAGAADVPAGVDVRSPNDIKRMDFIKAELRHRDLPETQQQKQPVKKAKPKKTKSEFKVGDVIENSEGVKQVIREIKGNSVYFTDENGEEYAGFSKSTLRELIKADRWKIVSSPKKSSLKDLSKKPKQNIEAPGIYSDYNDLIWQYDENKKYKKFVFVSPKTGKEYTGTIRGVAAIGNNPMFISEEAEFKKEFPDGKAYAEPKWFKPYKEPEILIHNLVTGEETTIPVKDETKDDPESKIINPIDTNASDQDKVKQLNKLSEANIPLIENFIKTIDEKFNTQSKWSKKEDDKIISKGSRPEILKKKPYHKIEHIRDSLRFKTVLDNVDTLPQILEEIIKAGYEIVKTDTEKLTKPKEWGWRFVAFDLRMPNGQLVEYYLPVKELEAAKKAGNHDLFEKWREKTDEEREANKEEYYKDLAASRKRYNMAWDEYLDRVGQSPTDFFASWNKTSASLSETISKLSLRSSADGGVSIQEPDLLVSPSHEPSELRQNTNASPEALSTDADISSGVSIAPKNKKERGNKQASKSQQKIKDKIKSIENDELKDALDDFLGSMNKLTTGIDSDQLAKGMKVMQVYAKLGTYKFADIVTDLYIKIGDRVRDLYDALKQSYAAYRENAPDDIFEQMDSNTRGVDLDKIINDISIGESKSEVEDGNLNDERGSDRPIEGEGSEEIQSVEEEESTDELGDRGEQDDTEQLPGDTGQQSADQQPGSQRTGDGRPSLNQNNHRIKSGSLTKTSFSEKQRYEDNIAAIKLLKTLQKKKRKATKKEKETLAKYVGWGGLSKVFQGYGEWESRQEELEKLLTEDEYRRANASIINAHYTSESVINNVWKVINKLGFTGGTILEPGMGIGHFFGLMPKNISDNSKLMGVELDDITAQIAQYLYPDAEINQGRDKGMGYQEMFIPSNSVNLVVGNVPFADIKIFDESEPDAWWSKSKQSLHNFFIAKSMDKLKPGGLMVLVTTHFTMDGKNPILRRKIAEQADLIAAFKLPNDAFKGNAGTEVTTDILVFRKKDPDNPIENLNFKPSDWINSVEQVINRRKINVNEYFLQNPKNVFGELSSDGSMYGYRQSYRDIPEGELTVKPQGSLDDHFRKAVNRLPKDLYTAKIDPITETKTPKVRNILDDMKRKLPGVMTVRGDKVYVLDNEGNPQEMPELKKEADKIKSMDSLRNNLIDLFEQQMKTPDDAAVQYLVEKYERQYDKFVDKYGNINSPANIKLFNTDPDYGRLRALEVFNEDKKIWEKSGLLKGRVFKATKKPEKFDSIKEAFAYVQATYGKLNFKEISRLTNQDSEAVISELLNEELIFEDLNGDYVLADEYLTGEVVKKLREAEQAARRDAKYKRNVEALQAVQPKPVPYTDIETKVGANFVPGKVYTDFVAHLLQVRKPDIEFRWMRTGDSSLWIMKQQDFFNQNTRNKTTFGTQEYSAIEILHRIMNNKSLAVYRTDNTGKRYFDANATMEANQKAEDIQTEWQQFLSNNIEASKAVEQGYNDIMNTSVRRTFNGSHLKLEGVANIVDGREYIFRPYQKNAIWRGIQNKNNLFDHPVGSGKTGTLTALIMERRRMGLTKKALYVTKKGLVDQVFREAQALYPNARILKPEKTDFEKKNRPTFLNRIKTNDWDFVVVSMENMKNISLSPELELKYAEEQMQELEEAIAAASEDNDNPNNKTPTQKQLEKKKQRLEEKIRERKAQLAKGRKSTAGQIEYFDQLGFDYLVVDEAHNYKNLFAPTSRSRVKGIGQSESQRSFDMMNKLWWMNKQENMGVTFATGTPVSNALTEFYIMQRYLQPDRLKEKNVYSLDDWLDIFTETQSKLELTAEGKGMRVQTRVGKLVNLPELLKLYSETTDIVTKEEVQKHLTIPQLEGGKAQNVEVEASDEQIAYYESLAIRAENIRDGTVTDPSVDNFLKITTEGRKAALDIRLVVDNAPDSPNSKVNTAVRNIYDIWKETAKNKSTQLVFMDLGAPGGSAKVDLYADMKQKLLKRGVPKEEIAFIHDAKNDKQLKALYKKVNEGKIRIFFGSTAKMSEGVNVQKKLYALHHMDPTYKPSELEQREGRILRHGNENKTVRILRYVTKGVGSVSGFDAYMYQLLENKIRGISQASNPDTTVRSVEEAEGRALTYAEIKALATGNPLIMEKIQLDNDVDKLISLRMAHAYQMQTLEYEKKQLPGRIQKYEEWIRLFNEALKELFPETQIITIKDLKSGKELTFDETQDKEWKKNAGEAIVKAYQHMAETKDVGDRTLLGEYGGFDLWLQIGEEVRINMSTDDSESTRDYKKRIAEEIKKDAETKREKTGILTIRPKDTKKYAEVMGVVDKSDFVSIVGGVNINRILEHKDKVQAELKYSTEYLEELREKLAKIDQEIIPFKREDEYQAKAARLIEVNKLLDVDKAATEDSEETGQDTDEDSDIDTESSVKEDLEDAAEDIGSESEAKRSPVYEVLRDSSAYYIDAVAKATGKAPSEIRSTFIELEVRQLIKKQDNYYLPTPEFKVLLDDIFNDPDKYEADYPNLYSNPIPAILKGMNNAITFLDDVFAKHIGSKIHSALGKGLKKITPEIIKRNILSNYGLPAEYSTLRQEAYENVGAYKQLALELADLLTYSDVKKKIKFTKGEQMRLAQIIKGSVTSNPLLKERGRKAIEEIKRLEVLAKELEVLPIETYNTKLPRKRIAELLETKAKAEKKLEAAKDKLYAKYKTTIEDQQQKIKDLKEEIKSLEKDDPDRDGLKADIQAAEEKIKELRKDLYGRQVNAYQAEVDGISRKIKNSFVHGGEGYFKRVYLSKEQEKILKKYGYAKPTRLDLTSAIARKDIPYEVRKKMGEVLTASYPVAKSIMLEGKDVSLGRFFAAVAENPSWSMTKAEYDAAPRENFVQLPKDPKLGKLSEKYVLDSIKKDIDDIIKFTDPDYIETFLKQIQATWKATKTIMNPSTHLRNIYSNSIMLDYSGVSHADQIRLMPEVIKMLLGEGKYATKWKLSRLDTTTFQYQELQTYLDVVGQNRQFANLNAEDKAKMLATKIYGKVSLVDTKLGEFLGKVYQLEEVVAKGIKFASELEKGKTIADAKKEAQKWLFDYSDIPSLIRKLRTNPFFGIPFITWSYKAFPRIIEAAITRPIAFWKYPVIFSAIMKYSLQALDLDDDDWEELKNTLPDRMLKGEWLLLPFKDEAGKMQMLDLTYILPFKDVYDIGMSGYMLATEGKFNTQDSFVEGILGMVQAPVFKTAAELMANKNTYNNAPIWFDMADSPTEKAQKAFDYIYKTFMPALAPEIPLLSAGGYAWNKLASVVMERDDYYGRSFTLAPAIASSFFGLKTSPLEPEKNLERAAFKLQSEINELGRKRNQILRDGGMSEEKRLAEAGRIDERIDQIREEIKGLNVPEYATDIQQLEKEIRSLQRKRAKETNQVKRKELTTKINRLKIQVDKAKAGDDIYMKEGEQKAKASGYGSAYQSGYSF